MAKKLKYNATYPYSNGFLPSFIKLRSHTGRQKLQGGKEAVPGYGETSQLHQPVPRHRTRDMLDHIKALPKPQDLSDLQARVDCLLRENGELKAKVEEGEVLRKEVGELKNRIAAMEKEVKTAKIERDKSKEVAQKIHGYLGYPGDVLNKARLYDHSLK